MDLRAAFVLPALWWMALDVPGMQDVKPGRLFLAAPAQAEYSRDVHALTPSAKAPFPGSGTDVLLARLEQLAAAEGGVLHRLSPEQLSPKAEFSPELVPFGSASELIDGLREDGQAVGYLWIANVGEMDSWGLLRSVGENRIKVELWDIAGKRLLLRDQVTQTGTAAAFRDPDGNLTEQGVSSVVSCADELHRRALVAIATSDPRATHPISAEATVVATEWEAYVARFIVHYGLSDRQAKEAWGFCRRAQERAAPLVRRIPAGLGCGSTSQSRAPEIGKEVEGRARAVLVEIDRLFDEQLRNRLLNILTAKQRESVSKEPTPPRLTVTLLP